MLHLHRRHDMNTRPHMHRVRGGEPFHLAVFSLAFDELATSSPGFPEDGSSRSARVRCRDRRDVAINFKFEIDGRRRVIAFAGLPA